MAPAIKTSQTIVLVAAALCLTCACGIGYRGPSSPPPPPPPITALSVDTTSLVFPATLNRTESKPLQIIVTNDYTEPVDFSTAESLPVRKNFRVDANHCHYPLDPHQTCTINVTYTPTTEGQTHGTLLILFGGYRVLIDLEGTSVLSLPSTSP